MNCSSLCNPENTQQASWVVGKEKAKIIRAALIGNLVDSLYIDAPTAEEIVRLTPV